MGQVRESLSPIRETWVELRLSGLGPGQPPGDEGILESELANGTFSLSLFL